MFGQSQKQSDAWHHLHDPLVREVFFGGGARSGKSILLCTHEIVEAATWPKTRGLIAREEFTALQDSTMKTFFEEVMPVMGYLPGREFSYNGQDKIVSWANGSETMFRHMKYQPSDPNYSRIGSTAYTRVSIDEGDEVGLRVADMLRARTGYNQPPHGGKMLVTGNPGDYWTKKRYVFNDDGTPVILHPQARVVLATVMDNPDPEVREHYRALMEEMVDPFDKARLLYGDWMASPKVDQPFAFRFEWDKHRKACSYIPGRVVYISIDFNVDPFCASLWHMFRDQDGDHAWCFREVSISPGTVKAMAERLRSEVGDITQIEVTGDRGGASRRIGMNSNVSLFDDLARVMRLSNRQLALPPNPPHLQSREDCNYVLANHPDVRIDPSCVKMLHDMQVVAVDDSGSIIKKDRTLAAQQADMLDTFRYFVNTYLYPWFKANRKSPSPLRKLA